MGADQHLYTSWRSERDSNPRTNTRKPNNIRELPDTTEAEVTKTCPNRVENEENTASEITGKPNITQVILEITKLDIPDSEKSRLIDLLLR